MRCSHSSNTVTGLSQARDGKEGNFITNEVPGLSEFYKEILCIILFIQLSLDHLQSASKVSLFCASFSEIQSCQKAIHKYPFQFSQ